MWNVYLLLSSEFLLVCETEAVINFISLRCIFRFLHLNSFENHVLSSPSQFTFSSNAKATSLSTYDCRNDKKVQVSSDIKYLSDSWETSSVTIKSPMEKVSLSRLLDRIRLTLRTRYVATWQHSQFDLPSIYLRFTYENNNIWVS